MKSVMVVDMFAMPKAANRSGMAAITASRFRATSGSNM